MKRWDALRIAGKAALDRRQREAHSPVEGCDATVSIADLVAVLSAFGLVHIDPPPAPALFTFPAVAYDSLTMSAVVRLDHLADTLRAAGWEMYRTGA